MKTTILRAALQSGSKRILACLALALAVNFSASDAYAISIPLGTAANYAILGGSAVTFTAPMNTVTGDVGVSPGTSITGAGANLTLTGTSAINNGSAAQAQLDATAAYGLAAGAATTATFGATDNQLGGKILTPGVYKFGHGDTANLLGTLTLDAQGNADALFIFQATSDFLTGAGSTVDLINGANPCNVIWQVSSSATLGASSLFEGTILALTSITVGSGVTVDGRLLAQNGLVSLINDTITTGQCCQPGIGGHASVPEGGNTLLLFIPALAALFAFRRFMAQPAYAPASLSS